MKTLQNNYTTPEQSKRLLELGVPKDSADCFYLREHPDRLCILNDGKTLSELRLQLYMAHAMPCWSVGRLMEIYDMCVMNSTGSWADYTTRLNYVNYLVSCFEISDFDFSKLEE